MSTFLPHLFPARVLENSVHYLGPSLFKYHLLKWSQDLSESSMCWCDRDWSNQLFYMSSRHMFLFDESFCWPLVNFREYFFITFLGRRMFWWRQDTGGRWDLRKEVWIDRSEVGMKTLTRLPSPKNRTVLYSTCHLLFLAQEYKQTSYTCQGLLQAMDHSCSKKLYSNSWFFTQLIHFIDLPFSYFSKEKLQFLSFPYWWKLLRSFLCCYILCLCILSANGFSN